jgi:hypothetical protein
MPKAPLARIAGLIVGLAILGGVPHSSEQPAPELPTIINTANACDPDTTCEGLEAEVESTYLDQATQTPAHEAWTMTSTCQHNTIGGPGGWTCTQDGIPADRECVVHISAQPYRSLVVPDNSVLCDLNAVGYIQDEPQPAGAVCETDAECEAISGENYGYNWTGHDGQRSS